MTRAAGRFLIGAGTLLATATLFVAVIAVLRPHEVTRDPLVAIANVAALPPGVPVRIASSELVGLDAKAQRSRNWGFASGWAYGVRVDTSKELPIYLVRDGDNVRGFIGVDPRNRCEIELLTARTLPWGSFPSMLYDVCHGSIYDFAGEHIGGPSPWSLDELVVTVRGGRVYARTDEVIPGHLTRR